MKEYGPEINSKTCDGCGLCVKACPLSALVLVNGKVQYRKGPIPCLFCGTCENACKKHAIRCPMEIIIR